MGQVMYNTRIDLNAEDSMKHNKTNVEIGSLIRAYDFEVTDDFYMDGIVTERVTDTDGTKYLKVVCDYCSIGEQTTETGGTYTRVGTENLIPLEMSQDWDSRIVVLDTVYEETSSEDYFMDAQTEQLIEQYCQMVDMLMTVNETTTEHLIEQINDVMSMIEDDLVEAGYQPDEFVNLYIEHTQRDFPLNQK